MAAVNIEIMRTCYVARCRGSRSSYIERLNWAIPEKKQTGGLRIWNFEEHQRNSMWNVKIKNEVEFPDLTKKKSCGISRGLGFRAWNFQGK